MSSAPTTTDGWRGLPGPGFAEPHLLAALDHCAERDVLGENVLVGYDGRAGAPNSPGSPPTSWPSTASPRTWPPHRPPPPPAAGSSTRPPT